MGGRLSGKGVDIVYTGLSVLPTLRCGSVLADFCRHEFMRPRGGEDVRRAAAAGVNIVPAAGGVGTIRTVAQELMGTGMPLGLLPAGTGNLWPVTSESQTTVPQRPYA